MAGILGDDQKPIAEINVVPLVDIILVVLIIFMVTAPLVMKAQIDVNLPKSSSGEQSKGEKNFEVVISQQGEIFLEGQNRNLEELRKDILEKIKASPNISASLTADKNVRLETLTSVIDTIKESGIQKLGFSVRKK